MKSGGYNCWVGGELLRLFTNEVWFSRPPAASPQREGLWLQSLMW